MVSKKHKRFNFAIILVPWLTLLFIGKRSFRRYSFSGMFIIVFEIINHLYGHRKKWWKFYDKRTSFLRDELPFSIGPYMPLSMWLLKISYGNFKKYLALNVIADGLFAFVGMDLLKKLKIIRLNKLTRMQFFFYIHYKAYLLYAVQYLFEKTRRFRMY
ncbi:hypothetical protein FZW96_16115 [Bacillus sp. BGMRC 2118]|nr:hypothetical protein FZW96_16115 [Bacillus sp. BGMRC 2118]